MCDHHIMGSSGNGEEGTLMTDRECVLMPLLLGRDQRAAVSARCDPSKDAIKHACLFFHLSPFFSMIQTRPVRRIVEGDTAYCPRWVFVIQRGWGITSPCWPRQG